MSTELQKAILVILDHQPEKELVRMLKNMLYSARHSEPEKQYPIDIEFHKEISGFPEYAVTSLGRVFSHKTNRFLKTFESSAGYKIVTLRANNKSEKFSVHRLVALAFRPNNDYETLEVNHLDGNKFNNHANNLKWVSHSDNIKHSYLSGRRAL